ncbi:MalY/PatB family protein [Parathalassolituus penaei]|uniref:cysteine-S-conjugate beta-lyase n=1 Tax=Parathalassolituus penaei TaxID=2997323 RepID=A0A9X3ED51_9GAMM|nr:MalY/PatB family protein [Parathalassolituus penaei]MCY0965403.1 pyridoxal phosphate-dependent aminotransferase [Parathalassolituus penaei]
MSQPQFDFDTVINRHGSGSFKWDSTPDTNTLPMFVADMDFRTAPAILDALHQRIDHGVFGYTWIRDEYYEALNHWFSSRYGMAIGREEVLPTLGVVPAISAILRAEADHCGHRDFGVIVQTPVYHCFFSCIRHQGARIVENALQMDEQGRYQIDFDDLEQKAAHPGNRVMLLCHPHNPSGRVWSREELQRIGEICARHQVLVVSDEIHCDLTFPGIGHTPFATLSPEFGASCITLNSPSKTFNIAGLQIANLIIQNPTLRNRVRKAMQIHEIGSVNALGVESLIAAYQQGDHWLEALRDYLYQNYRTIQQFLQEQLPELTLYPQDSTYLAWINCAATGLDSAILSKRLLEEGQLRISSGCGFLPAPDPQQCYIRLNFACPNVLLLDGLQRLAHVIRPLLTDRPLQPA